MQTLKSVLARILRPLLVTLGWSTCLCGITIWAIFQGLLLPRVQGGLLPEVAQGEPLRQAAYYLAWIVLGVLAAITLRDLGVAILSYLVSYGLGAALTYYVLALPGLIASDPAFREILVQASVNWTFQAFFPLPIFLGFIGTIAGTAIDEMLF